MSRSMMVLHVLNGASGGAAMSTISLIENLASKGIQSCAVCDERGTVMERTRLKDAVGGKVLFAPLYWWNRKTRSAAWKRPLLEMKQLFRTGWKTWSTGIVVRAVRNWRPDLIHTNTLLTPEGGLASRKMGLPHVWHARELVGPGFPFQFGRTEQVFGSYVARYSDRVIANSNATAAQLNKWLPPGFVCTIPNGIDCASFTTKARCSTARPLIVAMVANLASRSKNHQLFIKAAAAVDRRLPIEWRIYGHDPSEGGRSQIDSYINSLHALARNLNLETQLHYPGHVPPEQIMSEIDLLVHPSEVESFGRVVVEAMAGGVPVVGVKGGGVAEILNHGECGLLAQPNDPEDLARCIEKLIDDRAFATESVEKGRNRAREEYSIGATSLGVARVYEEVLESCRGKLPLLRQDGFSVGTT
jgi:glycosyltransferase involved in cell wall biosynthesis